MKRILAILCVIACLCGLCVPAMAAGTITVSVKAPDDWGQVCLYVWENDTPMESWPGSAMTKGADCWVDVQLIYYIFSNFGKSPRRIPAGTVDFAITFSFRVFYRLFYCFRSTKAAWQA